MCSLFWEICLFTFCVCLIVLQMRVLSPASKYQCFYRTAFSDYFLYSKYLTFVCLSHRPVVGLCRASGPHHFLLSASSAAEKE